MHTVSLSYSDSSLMACLVLASAHCELSYSDSSLMACLVLASVHRELKLFRFKLGGLLGVG